MINNSFHVHTIYFISSVGVRKAWSLGWEWGSLAAIETGAPSASFAHSCASAFPGFSALLGTLPVVRFGDGAVVVMGSRLLIGSPVTLVEHLSVIEIEEVELIVGSNGSNNGCMNGPPGSGGTPRPPGGGGGGPPGQDHAGGEGKGVDDSLDPPGLFWPAQKSRHLNYTGTNKLPMELLI